MYIFNKMAQNKYPHTKMNKYENSKNITESQNPGLQMLYPRVSCLVWETYVVMMHKPTGCLLMSIPFYSFMASPCSGFSCCFWFFSAEKSMFLASSTIWGFHWIFGFMLPASHMNLWGTSCRYHIPVTYDLKFQILELPWNFLGSVHDLLYIKKKWASCIGHPSLLSTWTITGPL